MKLGVMIGDVYMNTPYKYGLVRDVLEKDEEFCDWIDEVDCIYNFNVDTYYLRNCADAVYAKLRWGRIEGWD